MATVDNPPGIFFRKLLWAADLVLPRNRWGDRLWLRLRFWVAHGRMPSDQMRYNDRVLAYITSDDAYAPLVAETTCKHTAKEYLRQHIDAAHIIPTLGHLRTAEDIDAYAFPDNCVIKGTAASGQVILRRDGAPVDRATLKSWLRVTHYDYTREACYLPLRNAIIVEPIIGGTRLMDDLKFITFGGTVRWIYHNTFEGGVKTRRIYDRNWNTFSVSKKYPLSQIITPKPATLDQMIAAAEKVAAAFAVLRVDFYFMGADWWIGELTHCDSAAESGFIPLEGEALINRLSFGDAGFAGPIERHGAMGSKGQPATFAEMGLRIEDSLSRAAHTADRSHIGN